MKKLIILLSCVFVLYGCQVKPVQSISASSANLKSPFESFIEQHKDLEIVYKLVADIDSDNKPDNFLVSKKDLLQLWFIDETGNGKVIAEAKGMDYLSTDLVDRGNEKHLAFMGYYEPSNTNLWVVRMKNGSPSVVFEFMADWKIRISDYGFDMTWKKYNSNTAVGGYDLVVDKYYWDESKDSYIKSE